MIVSDGEPDMPDMSLAERVVMLEKQLRKARAINTAVMCAILNVTKGQSLSKFLARQEPERTMRKIRHFTRAIQSALEHEHD